MSKEPGRPGPGSPGVLQRLKAAGLAPRKGLGQHFLHDPKLLEAMTDAAELTPGEGVFEVGTGPGTLTRHLAAHARRVFSVEVDARLVAFAGRELEDLDNVEILEADVLERKSQLNPQVAEKLRELGAFRWVSNLPYSVATPLILAVLGANLPWRRCVLTVQWEMAERLCAAPGDPGYGAATALVRFWAIARTLRRIGAGTFWPPPRVESAVLELEPRDPPLVTTCYQAYRTWVRALFRSRRKQLRTLLKEVLGPAEAARALELGGWEPERRAETFDVSDFLLLAENFRSFSH